MLKPALVENDGVARPDKGVVTVNGAGGRVGLPPVEAGEALDLLDEPAFGASSSVDGDPAPPPMLGCQ